ALLGDAPCFAQRSLPVIRPAVRQLGDEADDEVDPRIDVAGGTLQRFAKERYPLPVQLTVDPRVRHETAAAQEQIEGFHIAGARNRRPVLRSEPSRQRAD